ncbi:MAG: hypothetical protein PHE50_00140 [Dehalococcoidales bacterium]|nr:hypothetical protein [Dehalococcoidales bacterium]
MNELVKQDSPLSVSDVKGQIQVIQHVMREAMVKGTHFGIIPGCGDKPTLLKPGAEKLCLTFRLSPTYKVEKTDLPNGHREYDVLCTLTHIPSDKVFGQGVGLCSTMESKFRYRKAERKCPACSNTSIIKGKKEYGGGWLCFAKKGGCGAKFKDGDKSIEDQDVGRSENPDLADSYNTILKMAKKRAHVDAVITALAASDIFAQDLEDLTPSEDPYAKYQDLINLIKESISTEDYYSGSKAWFESSDDTKTHLWVAPTKGGPFTTEECKVIKSTAWREAYYGKTSDVGDGMQYENL